MWRVLVALILLLTVAGIAHALINSGGRFISLAIQLRINGPVYQGSFYKGFLPATDYAVWIEDEHGNYVETLAISESVVTVGEYSHVEHLPTWQQASGVTYEALQGETADGVAPSFDAVTSASVRFTGDVAEQTLTCVWPVFDVDVPLVEPGLYNYCAEVANITKDEAAGYRINAETTRGTVDVEHHTAQPAAPTSHILSLSASFSTVAVPSNTWARLRTVFR